jgi:protein LTV1
LPTEKPKIYINAALKPSARCLNQFQGEPYGWNNGQGQGPLPNHIRKEIIELIFPDDGYNYLTHLREIRVSGGGSAFVPCRKPRLESIPPDVKAYDASNLQAPTCNEDDSNSSAL